MAGHDRVRDVRGVVGTVASIVASILIMAVLIAVYKRGPEAAFEWPCTAVLWLLILVGVAAYYGYTGYARASLERMRKVSPIALALGAAGIIAGEKMGVMAGGALIVLAYMVETSVGLALARDYEEESRAGSLLFLAGVSLFVASLPLMIVDRRFALLGIAGDTIKIVGLLLVLASIASRLGSRRTA